MIIDIILAPDHRHEEARKDIDKLQDRRQKS